jgi:ABC-type xylose transport system substrate-binding protein
MQVGGVLNAQVGLALFDDWLQAVQSRQHPQVASPLIDAAFKAFDTYLEIVEAQHTAQIAGAAIYALNPQGMGAVPVTRQDIAPFLALNILA